MKLKIFAIKDRVEMTFKDVLTSPNAATLVRMIRPTLERRPEFKDYDLYELAEFDNETGEITATKAKQVDWNSYQFENASEKRTEEQHNETVSKIERGEI